MPEVAPPAQSSRPRRRKRWLIPAVTLAALIVLIGGWYAWINRPAGRAQALLEEIRRRDSKDTGFIDRLRGELGFRLPRPRLVFDIAADLSGLGHPVVPVLVDALKDSSPAVRGAAARALGDIGDAAAVPPLQALMKDPVDEVRATAAEALGDMDDRRAVPDLLAALKDPVSQVRIAATYALGRVGDPEALPAVLDVVKGHPGGEEEGAALTALGRVGGAADLPVLTAALSSPEVSLRRAAVYGLGRIGGPDVVPPLQKALADPDKWVRGAAAEELGNVGNPRAAGSLVAATRDADAWVRCMAVFGLAGVGAPEAGDAAVPLLQDEDLMARAMAALVCGLRGRAEALPELSEELLGADEWAAFNAVAGLAKLDTPQARQALEEGARAAQSELVRELAALALKDGLMPALAAELRMRPDEVIFRTGRILVCLNDPSALPALEEARKTGLALTRGEAARVLSHLRRRLPPATP